MAEPVWVLRATLDAVHDIQIAEHGGAPGVRDEGLLSSALARPQNQYAYGETDLCMLAAAYAYGLVRNHAFVDGNKRTAFLAAFIFLRINGRHLTADEAAATVAMEALAADSMTETAFAAWLRANTGS